MSAWLVCEKLVRYSSGIGLFIGASMQLHVRLGAPRDQSRKGIERHLDRPVQRKFMHLVERLVHQPREQALDPEATPDEPAHQASDGRIFTERHKRDEIPVAPGLERLARQAPLDLLEHMGRLLVRRLGARWNVLARFLFPCAGRTVADDENPLVARSLQSGCDDQLVEMVSL